MGRVAAAASLAQVGGTDLKGLSLSCPWNFVHLGSMVCNSHRELTSLGSCSTRDGPRPPACRHPDRALQPHEPWPGRPSSAVPRHRPSPLRPTAALLQNGLALRLGRQSCVSMHPVTPQITSHPGSTAAVWHETCRCTRATTCVGKNTESARAATASWAQS